MAHKTEKEDAVSVPEKNTITLCVNCGVATSINNNNSCQKCLNSCSSTNINHLHVEKSSVTIYTTSPPRENTISIPVLPMLSITKRVVNRCAGCRKKVGLTGFKCRCGDTFCSDHRYSDRHDCNYDYKAAGREVIKRENPVIKADKIVRI